MRAVGGVRRSATALVALVVTTSGLMAVGAVTPAAAGQVIACTETIESGGWAPPRPNGYDRVRTAVLTVQLDPAPYEPDRELALSTDGSYDWFEDRVAMIDEGARAGTYVFTTDAGTSVPTAWEPGTYPGGRMLESFAGGYGYGPIRVSLGPPGRPEPYNSWSLTLTFVECDSDGDGAPDTSDNCAFLANDQADSDRDGVGNGCDSTPFPPAPPPAPAPAPAPVPAPGPAPGPAPPGTSLPGDGTTSPGIAAVRTATLKYVKKKSVFRGSVRSEFWPCAAYAEVVLWQKKRGADRRLVTRHTDEGGSFRTAKVRRAGTYYVTVAPRQDGACAGARSATVRLSAR